MKLLAHRLALFGDAFRKRASPCIACKITVLARIKPWAQCGIKNTSHVVAAQEKGDKCGGTENTGRDLIVGS